MANKQVAHIKAKLEGGNVGEVLDIYDETALHTVDIANNLTTTATGKVLDATQGKALKDQADTSTTNIATLTTRVNNIANLPSGSTTGDAELADIRVGYDDTTYVNAGTSVREQIKTVKDLCSTKDLVEIGFVLQNAGKFVNATNGALGNSDLTTATNYIDISSYRSISYKRRGSSSTTSVSAGMAFYDSTKTYISGTNDDYGYETSGYLENLNTVFVPDNAIYARFSTYTDTATYGNFAVYGRPLVSDELEGLKAESIEKDTLIQGPNWRISERTTSAGLTIKHIGKNRILLNGTTTNNHAITLNKNAPYPRYTVGGFSSGFFASQNVPIPIESGHEFRIHFDLISGSFEKNGVTYTNFIESRNVNVCKAFLLNPSATSSSEEGYYYMYAVSGYVTDILNVDSVGALALYVYNNVTCNDAVVECWLEDITKRNELLSEYCTALSEAEDTYDASIWPWWKDEISTSIDSIHDNIINSSLSSSTILFITDLHWNGNKKRSPRLVKEIIRKTNIDYLICGGDLVKSYHSDGREGAEEELWGCLNAFRNVGKPMITLYGNHDRNSDGNPNSDSANVINRKEHLNIVYKSFLPNKDITFVNDTSHDAPWDLAYWEDDTYRYAMVYWYYSSSRTVTWVDELFNTTKPVIVFYHGVYITLGLNNKSDDVIQGQWLLNALEGHKSQIKCIVQGHAHWDGLRYAYDGEVPIICIDQDTFNDRCTIRTPTEQSFAVITFDTNEIKVVKVGRGIDFTVDANTAEFTLDYENLVLNPVS